MPRPKPNRDRSLLHPAFLAKVEALESAIKAQGLPFALYEGYRGPARQNSGYARGKSRARWTQSWHNYGTAGDFVALADFDGDGDDDWSWAGNLDANGNHVNDWQEYGVAVETVGLAWSGRWQGKLRELVHCQLPQWSLRDLKLAKQVETADMGSEAWARYVSHWWAAMEGYGPGVACRQRLLVVVGLDPGRIDGHDGPKTQAATVAYCPGDYGREHLAEVRRRLISDICAGVCEAA